MRKYLHSFIPPVIISIPLSILVELFEKYIFSDWDFLRFLVVFLILDTLTSWWYHIREKDFSSKGFAQLFVKLIIYSILLIVAHVFTGYTIQSNPEVVFDWFGTFICTALLVREGISIVENLNKIKPGLIPKIITKYLKDFDEKGIYKKEQQDEECDVPS
jgi:toxin secretion/phage lysis holin